MTAHFTWHDRMERASHLAEVGGPSQQVVAFYAEVLKWQYETFKHLTAHSRARRLTGSFEADHPALVDRLGSLVELARLRGSETLSAQAAELAANPGDWKDLLATYWNDEKAPEESFFARACLQPYLELLANTQTFPFDSKLTASAADRIEKLGEAQPHRVCPFCGRKPQLAFLSNDTSLPGIMEGSTEGGRRFLMCGDCRTIWPFQRIACARCQEGNPHKLPYYTADDLSNIRVECCDACRHYIKSIDLTKDNRAVPPVDELAAVPLDLWAQQQGYTKILRNLAGI